jgi:hypothetical protein
MLRFLDGFPNWVNDAMFFIARAMKVEHRAGYGQELRNPVIDAALIGALTRHASARCFASWRSFASGRARQASVRRES